MSRRSKKIQAANPDEDAKRLQLALALHKQDLLVVSELRHLHNRIPNLLSQVLTGLLVICPFVDPSSDFRHFQELG